ncbi:MAG: RMD1 family protein [Deltaproteobacteria bacterium]|nr:RMD1 family protein [Deltaproteobacteria bacterium]
MNQKTYWFRSYHVLYEIDPKDIVDLFPQYPVHSTRLMASFELKTDAYCLIYKFGTIVFFNSDEEIQKNILQKLQERYAQKLQNQTHDEYSLILDSEVNESKVGFNSVIVKAIDPELVATMSLIIAQSVALDHYEQQVALLMTQLKQASKGVGVAKRRRYSSKITGEMIERIIAIKQDLVISLRLLDKPESTWEKKTLDDLYEQGIRMFEIKERFGLLQDRLEIIQGNLEVIAQIANDKKMIRLEIAIVALFVIDIALVLFDFLHRWQF